MSHRIWVRRTETALVYDGLSYFLYVLREPTPLQSRAMREWAKAQPQQQVDVNGTMVSVPEDMTAAQHQRIVLNAFRVAVHPEDVERLSDEQVVGEYIKSSQTRHVPLTQQVVRDEMPDRLTDEFISALDKWQTTTPDGAPLTPILVPDPDGGSARISP